MTKLEFLEVNRNFVSYYKTLRDLNYYLTNSELGQEQINEATTVMTKLIFDFIQTNGTTFRDMDMEKYTKEYEMFHQDFLRIIENSGVNNVDFDEFAGLLDELIQIANHRMTALQKIKTSMQEMELSNEDVEPLENETQEENNQLPITQMVLENKPEFTIETIKSDEESTVNSELDDNDEDFESRSEILESDDVFHYRPKRRRFR
jgi:hypothetical protein